MAKTKLTDEQKDARRELKRLVKRGGHVFCVLTHCGRTGMNRSVQILVPWLGRRYQEGKKQWAIRDISGLISDLGTYEWDDKHGGVKVGGCGFDAGGAVVMDMSRELYGDAYTVEYSWL